MKTAMRVKNDDRPEASVSEVAHSGGRPWVRPLLLGLALIAMLLAAKAFGLGARLGELRTWILGLKAWGPVVFIAFYAVAVFFVLRGATRAPRLEDPCCEILS